MYNYLKEKNIQISDRFCIWIAVFLALVFFMQGFLGNSKKSLTWDEPSFISAGYVYLTKNDFSLNPSHPPLMQQLEAFPLLFLDLNWPKENESVWMTSKNPVIKFGELFLCKSGNNVYKIAFWSRLPVLLIGTGLILAIFFWGKQIYGVWPALVCTVVAAFSPNLIAHSKVATEDLGCTAFMFISVWTYWLCFRDKKMQNWILCGLITGFALSSKYTALLLGPIYVFILIGLWLFSRDTLKDVSLIKGFFVITFFSVFVVGAVYNFTFDYRTYIKGIFSIYSDVDFNYKWYLFGKCYDKPIWYYYVMTLLVKTPLPSLLLIVIALVSVLRKYSNFETLIFIVVPIFVIIVVSFFDRANLGLRRILPAFPFLFLFIGQSMIRKANNKKLVIILLMMLWIIVEAVRIYPHHLSYFNTIVGGPERGPYILNDSNIDWGQDLPSLYDWQKKQDNNKPIKILYFGSVLPEVYKVKSINCNDSDIIYPSSGVYAISTHYLATFNNHNKELGVNIDWLTKYKPIARAGYSIYIYKFR